MHILMLSSFFLTKSTSAPQGKKLGLMKPLSKSSYSCIFNSFNSVGTILQGAFEIGDVSGVNSISNSISLLGGNSGRSSGNTLGDSHTIGTSFGLSCVSHVLSTTLAINAWQPLLINRWALRAETNGMRVREISPLKVNCSTPSV